MKGHPNDLRGMLMRVKRDERGKEKEEEEEKRTKKRKKERKQKVVYTLQGLDPHQW